MLFPKCQVAYTLGCLLLGVAKAIAGKGIDAYLAKVISIQVVPLVLVLGGGGSRVVACSLHADSCLSCSLASLHATRPNTTYIKTCIRDINI